MEALTQARNRWPWAKGRGYRVEKAAWTGWCQTCGNTNAGRQRPRARSHYFLAATRRGGSAVVDPAGRLPLSQSACCACTAARPASRAAPRIGLAAGAKILWTGPKVITCFVERDPDPASW